MATDNNEEQSEPLQVPLLTYAEWYKYRPGLQRELERVIRDGQAKSKKKPPLTYTILEAHWTELGQILAAYLEGHHLNDLVLRKEDRRQLEAIAGTARKLITLVGRAVAIERENAPIKDVRTALFLCTWLDEQCGDADAFLKTLNALAELDRERDFEHRSAWVTAEEVSRRATYRSRFFGHLTRCGLQKCVNEWWQDKTGLAVSYDVEEKTLYDEKPPFAQFLFNLYAPMAVRNSPGTSRTAVKQTSEEAPDWAALKTHLEAVRDRLKADD